MTNTTQCRDHHHFFICRHWLIPPLFCQKCVVNIIFIATFQTIAIDALSDLIKKYSNDRSSLELSPKISFNRHEMYLRSYGLLPRNMDSLEAGDDNKELSERR